VKREAEGEIRDILHEIRRMYTRQLKMKPIKLFCLLLVLVLIAVGCKKKEPEPSYKMTEEEVKVLAETKSYLKARGQVDAIDDRGQTRLHTAAFEGYKEVVKLLIDNGADINAQGIGELRPLHFAAGRGHRDVVELLLAKGADPKAKLENHKTAVHLAVSGGYQDVAELLLQRGCDVNARDVEGMTPLHAAIEGGHKLTAELLILKGADLTAKAGGEYTPLQLAASLGRKDMVELLLAHGANMDDSTSESMSPLHWAAFEGHKNVVKALIAKGVDVNSKGKNGETPLHLAALEGHKEVVEFLLAHRADANAKDNNGMIPLDFAILQHHQDVAELLIEFFLRSARTTQDKIILFSILDRFGPYAVVPILKQYENPNSSKEQKDLAGMLILRLPDTKSVIDKVVEAYKHGRYFETHERKPDKDGVVKLSFKEFLDEWLSWWGNMVKRRYKGNKFFVKYVAEKHLADPGKQEKVIELLANIDFRTASAYFENLDYNALSDEALTMLIHSNFPPDERSQQDKCLPERFALFCNIFTKLEKSKREGKDMLFVLDDFPENLQQTFIVSNFKDFTQKERDHALYICSKLEPSVRNSTYDSIRSYCTSNQIMMIEHYEKK
jgi:cytohesin